MGRELTNGISDPDLIQIGDEDVFTPAAYSGQGQIESVMPTNPNYLCSSGERGVCVCDHTQENQPVET